MMHRPNLILIASREFRLDPAGPFLPLVRDYAATLRKFRLHATRGTAYSVLSTGEYSCDVEGLPYHEPSDPDLCVHRSGHEGGVVEIAALVPRRSCEAVFFFLDPGDPFSEAPENRALQRVCKELGVRLVSTFESARQWLEYESTSAARRPVGHYGRDQELPSWGEGVPNVDETTGNPITLDVEKQTLALIAHDRRKEDMILFVNRHAPFLGRFQRILTTGTTGFTLKLLFADEEQTRDVLEAAWSTLGSPRFEEFVLGAARLLARYGRDREASIEKVLQWAGGCPPDAQVSEFESELRAWIEQGMPRTNDTPEPHLVGEDDIARDLERGGLQTPQTELVGKIRPVPSGPKGGDIILANEVLTHRCHASVFFQDPQSAHAHDPDIRLFERTCHFWSGREPRNRIYVTCVSDPVSAHKWVTAVTAAEAEAAFRRSLRGRLCRRQEWNLRDVVFIDRFIQGESTPENIGNAIGEAASRYLLQDLYMKSQRSERVVVGVGHGLTIRRIVKIVKDKMAEGVFGMLDAWPARVTCVPLTANVSHYDYKRQATSIAHDLAEVLGAKPKAFWAPGLLEPADFKNLPARDKKLMTSLAAADIVLVAGGVYAGKVAKAHLVNDDDGRRRPVGIFSSIVLDHRGEPMEDPVKTVGIGFEGMREAAAKGSVLFLCCGEARQELLRCALKAGLISVLVTDVETAAWLDGTEGT